MICVILLPSSEMNSKASQFQGPPVSMAIGMEWCVVARVLYFAILLVAALFAAAPALQLFHRCEMRHMCLGQ